MTRYITLRANPQYAEFRSTRALLEFLDASGWRCASPQICWRNVLVLACADQQGNYTTHGAYPEEFNVAELICHDGPPFEEYEALARKLATFLAWEAWEDDEERQISNAD